jgi:hypothetical protein
MNIAICNMQYAICYLHSDSLIPEHDKKALDMN